MGYTAQLAGQGRRTLSYKDLQIVRIFVYLAKRGATGATRREIGQMLGIEPRGPRIRKLMHEMENRGFITVDRCVDELLSPFRYFVPEEAWQKPARFIDSIPVIVTGNSAMAVVLH